MDHLPGDLCNQPWFPWFGPIKATDIDSMMMMVRKIFCKKLQV